tara:strand:+ start:2546 stop:2995 length:450 start_codon:yes stop_codon:yes gene_type:complete
VSLPYASSTAGQAREKEIRDTLRSVGASAVGFMVDDDADQIVAQFRLHGREITIPINVGAYEAAWLRENPRGPRSRTSEKDHKAKARVQAERAAWAILADWIKATAAMMAAGFVDADTAFLPHVRTPSGVRVIEALNEGGGARLLPPPT